MTILSQENVRLVQTERQSLKQIFSPVSGDMHAVEACLADAFDGVEYSVHREIVDSLLASPGKRIRPALVLLAAGATTHGTSINSAGKGDPIPVAAAVELIHMASLIHDDMVDDAAVRHGRASVSARWGRKIAVTVGDHLCSHAMAMVAGCGDPRVFAIIGSRLSAMCEGELLQVADRVGVAVSERRCLAVIEKKTAGLFGACCEAGASVATDEPAVQRTLQQFGFHFGVAFQILDDCRDLLCEEQDLGKQPGQDLLAGDMTIPLLHALEYCRDRDGTGAHSARNPAEQWDLASLRDAFRSSRAPERIRQLTESHIHRAMVQLNALPASDFTRSLGRLARYITLSLSDVLAA